MNIYHVKTLFSLCKKNIANKVKEEITNERTDNNDKDIKLIFVKKNVINITCNVMEIK